METHSTQQIRVLCAHVSNHTGHTVTIHGWVHSIRHLGQLSFVNVRDRSGIIQCVLERELAETPLSLESVISITGTAILAPKSARRDRDPRSVAPVCQCRCAPSFRDKQKDDRRKVGHRARSPGAVA